MASSQEQGLQDDVILAPDHSDLEELFVKLECRQSVPILMGGHLNHDFFFILLFSLSLNFLVT